MWEGLVGWVSVFDWSVKAAAAAMPYLIGWGISADQKIWNGLALVHCLEGAGGRINQRYKSQPIIYEPELERNMFSLVCDIFCHLGRPAKEECVGKINVRWNVVMLSLTSWNPFQTVVWRPHQKANLDIKAGGLGTKVKGICKTRGQGALYHFD